MTKKKKIILFGSSGFIAKYFVDYLNLNNCSFLGIDIKKSNITSIIHDVREQIPLSNLPKEQVDLIINLAAIHREPGHKDHEYFDTNILGAENITQFAERVNCNHIIFTSSISPYGIEDKLKDEHTVPCPNTPYGSSKLAAEKIHIAWQNRDIKKRVLTIVRPGVVFGKGDEKVH